MISNQPERLKSQKFWLIAAGLFFFALILRLYKLYEAPGFYEANELQVTLNLVHGIHFPLYNQHPHIGAFANYLIAAFFKVFGLHWWLPRIIILFIGALTIPLTLLVGQRITDRRSAILAAILMACCMYHVLLLSHVPWSNCMSPFFGALTILCFLNAASTNKLVWYFVGGLFFGISLQTHPALITLALPILLISLFQGDTPFRKRILSFAPVIAMAGAVIGYLNMLVYNIGTRMGSVQFAMTYPTYAIQQHPEATAYVRNFKHATGLMLQLISGAVEVKAFQPFNWLTLALMLCGLMLLAGIVICVYKKSWVLPSLFLIPFLIVPLVNKSYEFCQFGRYLGFLLMPAYLLMATAMIRMFDFLRTRTHLAAIAFLFSISALFITAEADQFRKVENEMRSRNMSMLVFRKTVQQLPDKIKQYPIVVDRGTWKAISLIAFLQSDGWNARELLGTSPHEKMHINEGTFRATSLEMEMYKLKGENGYATAIVSPNILLALMRDNSVDSCIGCISVIEEGRYVRSLMSKTLYFFVAASNEAKHQKDPLLKVMRVLITEPDSRIRRSHSPKITSELQKTCGIIQMNALPHRKEICKPEKDTDNHSSRLPDSHLIDLHN